MMSKRSLVILSLLIVVFLGISAYALVPPLLNEGGGQAVASDAGGGSAITSGAAGGSVSSSVTGDSRLGDPGRTGSEADAAGPGSGSDGAGQGAEAPSPSSERQGAGGGGSGGGSSTASSAQSGAGTGGTGLSSGDSSSGDAKSSSASDSTVATPSPEAPRRIVTLSVDASTMGRHIMAPRTVEFSEGETVYDVLARECRASGIPMESSFNPLYNSRYVEGIDNLYEFDGGPQSGWMYAVNGWYPNYGCSAYVLSIGDIITWRYTCNLGSDIGGHNALG